MCGVSSLCLACELVPKNRWWNRLFRRLSRSFFNKTLRTFSRINTVVVSVCNETFKVNPHSTTSVSFQKEHILIMADYKDNDTFEDLPSSTITCIIFFGSIIFTVVSMATKAYLSEDSRGTYV